MVSWRTIMTLAALAVASVALAGWAWMQARAPLQVEGAGERLLPGLERRLGEVALLEVRRGAQRMVLRRRADGSWVAGEADWPVPTAQVRSVLMTLAQMKKVRPATALAERYRAIHVDDPGPDTLATQLVLKDAAGKVLADVILGKEASEFVGGGRTAQFVRLSSASRSWLVEGHVRAPLRISDWAETTLLKLADGRLESVEIRRDGEVVRLVAGSKGGARTQAGGDGKGRGTAGGAKDVDAWAGLPLRLADAPPGAKPHAPGVQRLAYALEELTFEDVRRADFLKDVRPQATTRIRASDGLKVVLRVYRVKGKEPQAGWWLRGEVVAAGQDAQLAEKLRRRFEGRAFRVYDSTGEILSARLEDFIRAEVHDLNGKAKEGQQDSRDAADTSASEGDQ